MADLRQILFSEIDGFKEQGHKFLNKELNVGQFKGISGGMGVYAHRGGTKFMIRLRVPSGVLDIEKFKIVCGYLKKYNLDGLHLTTREDVQLHGLEFDETIEIMKDALANDIYTRGGGGNFPRNVAISPLSGVEKDETFDVTPYALIVNKYFLDKIYTYHLPRKLKVSFSNSDEDTANCTAQDLGFIATVKDNKQYFRVFAGGGLGNNPRKGFELDNLIEPSDALYYVEGMTQLFINEGDYENKGKARIRYIAERMGREEFLKQLQHYVDLEKQKNNLNFEISETTINKKGERISFQDERVIEQSQEGLYSVYVHPIGGQLKLKDIENILAEADKIKDFEIRLSMSEGMYIRNLTGKEALNIFELTKNIGGIFDLEYSAACIGVPTCQVGIGQSQKLLNDIIKFFNQKGYLENILPKVQISGCQNSCATHEIAKIGFTGKKKRVEEELKEVFALSIGGSSKLSNNVLGIGKGDILSEKIPEFLYELYENIKATGLNFDDFIVEEENNLNKIIDKYLI